MSHVNKSNKNTYQARGHFIAALGLLFGAFCWGIIWYPYRLLAESGLSGAVSSFYTYCMAILIASVYSAQYWRSFIKQSSSIIWLAIVAGVTNLAYVLAVIDGEVMRVMLLFYLSPLWTLILAHFWLKEKTHFTGYIAIAVSLLGAFIMLYEPKLNSLPLPKNTSEWLALASGVGFSISNVITRQATNLTVRAKSFAVWAGVLLVSLAYILLSQSTFPSPQSITMSQFLYLFTATLVLMLATLAVQYGVTRMSAAKSSVLFLFELVVAAFASYFFVHESMSANEWVGGILIMAAAVFASLN